MHVSVLKGPLSWGGMSLHSLTTPILTSFLILKNKQQDPWVPCYILLFFKNVSQNTTVIWRMCHTVCCWLKKKRDGGHSVAFLNLFIQFFRSKCMTKWSFQSISRPLCASHKLLSFTSSLRLEESVVWIDIDSPTTAGSVYTTSTCLIPSLVVGISEQVNTCTTAVQYHSTRMDWNHQSIRYCACTGGSKIN